MVDDLVDLDFLGGDLVVLADLDFLGGDLVVLADLDFLGGDLVVLADLDLVALAVDNMTNFGYVIIVIFIFLPSMSMGGHLATLPLHTLSRY